MAKICRSLFRVTGLGKSQQREIMEKSPHKIIMGRGYLKNLIIRVQYTPHHVPNYLIRHQFGNNFFWFSLCVIHQNNRKGTTIGSCHNSFLSKRPNTQFQMSDLDRFWNRFRTTLLKEIPVLFFDSIGFKPLFRHIFFRFWQIIIKINAPWNRGIPLQGRLVGIMAQLY